MSLEKLGEILAVTLPDQSDSAFARLLSAQKDAAVAVVNIGLKVNDSALRKKETDALQQLLARVKGATLTLEPQP